MTTKSKATIAFIAVAAAAVTFALLRPDSGNGTGKQATSVTMTIGYQPTTFYTYLFLAEEEGYFADAGIVPEFIGIPSANRMFQAFLAGQLNMTGLTATEILLRGNEAEPGSFVSPLMVEINAEHVSDWVIVKNDSPIQSVADLKGRKVGTHPGSAVTGIFKRFLEVNGVDPQTVSTQELNPDVQVDSVLSGAVDAIICLEPTGTTLLQSGECRALYPNPFGVVVKEFPASFAAVDREFLNANPDVAERLFGVIKKSVKRYRELIATDRARIDRLVSEKLGVDPKIAAALSPVVYRLPDEWSDEAFAAAMQFYVENGVLKKPLSPSAIRWK